MKKTSTNKKQTVSTAKKSGTTQKKPVNSAVAQKRKKAYKKRQLHNLLLGLFLGFSLCLLGFSIYKLSSMFLVYDSSDEEYAKLQDYVLEEPQNPEQVFSDFEDLLAERTEEGEEDLELSISAPAIRINLEQLQNINSDVIGWIEIPNSSISYPLVQTSDNSYYLTHTFGKAENSSGCIFLETANDADFSDLHSIIYGHNMKNGSMFAGLSEYKEQSYQESHPYIYLDLEDGSHCYEIFSCHLASSTDSSYTIGYTANSLYESFLSTITDSSLYDTGVNVNKDDSVITLSTCASSGEDRFVVHAKKLY